MNYTSTLDLVELTDRLQRTKILEADVQHILDHGVSLDANNQVQSRVP